MRPAGGDRSPVEHERAPGDLRKVKPPGVCCRENESTQDASRLAAIGPVAIRVGGRITFA